MRKIYLILNIIFITAIVLLLDAYSESVNSSSAPFKKRRIKKQNVKVKLPFVQRSPWNSNMAMILANSKLFEANRGQEATKKEAPARPGQRSNFKLMGVCKFGKIEGAIIIDTSRGSKSNNKTFFKIGEEVGNGYKLYSVTKKNAILKNGSNKLTLDMAKNEVPNKPAPYRSSRTNRTSRYRRRR